MKKIGGYFTHETCLQEENHFFESITPAGGDFRFMMSGRCGNYYALQDICLSDKKRVAYVPAYTCETVLAPFDKAGFEMVFYPVSKTRLTPVFDPAMLEKISVISLCGYYGFSTYSQDFVRQCHERGIIVLEDTTHSIFSSDGISPYCDYVVGSLRKWIGVPAGGFAIKTRGRFTLPASEPNQTHLNMRADSMRTKARLSSTDDPQTEQELAEAAARFWDAELMLREIFSSFLSDEESARIMRHFPVDRITSRRRTNYCCLLEHFPRRADLCVIYPELPGGTVPSHFSIYAERRDDFKAWLLEHGISSTVYWPKNPYVAIPADSELEYIYDHILSLPCDQRYGEEDMRYICDVAASFTAP